jgi:hypothetical protein
MSKLTKHCFIFLQGTLDAELRLCMHCLHPQRSPEAVCINTDGPSSNKKMHGDRIDSELFNPAIGLLGVDDHVIKSPICFLLLTPQFAHATRLACFLTLQCCLKSKTRLVCQLCCSHCYVSFVLHFQPFITYSCDAVLTWPCSALSRALFNAVSCCLLFLPCIIVQGDTRNTTQLIRRHAYVHAHAHAHTHTHTHTHTRARARAHAPRILLVVTRANLYSHYRW